MTKAIKTSQSFTCFCAACVAFGGAGLLLLDFWYMNIGSSYELLQKKYFNGAKREPEYSGPKGLGLIVTFLASPRKEMQLPQGPGDSLR